jgi:iron(III) transport system substrate-binding protein
MLNTVKLIFVFFVFALVGFQARAVVTIKVISDRTEATLKPLFEFYEKTKGVKISAIYVDQGLVSRLESRPTEADVVITKDAELLEMARTKGLLQPFKSAMIEKNIPPFFRNGDGYYFIDAYRARVIIYSKARVKPSELSTYEDLASPKWKGKLCIRSGYHDYNVGLFSQMAASWGMDRSKFVMKGFHDNLAREPKGSDRDQAKAIFEGKCDVGIMNTYYYPLMMDSPEEKPWAEATRVFYPNQGDLGAFVMRSALGLTKAKDNVSAATALLEFFASNEGQNMISKTTYQFTTNPAIPMHEVLHKLGEGQPQVKDGHFKMNLVPLSFVAANRDAVVKYLNEINFDKH